MPKPIPIPFCIPDAWLQARITRLIQQGQNIGDAYLAAIADWEEQETLKRQRDQERAGWAEPGRTLRIATEDANEKADQIATERRNK